MSARNRKTREKAQRIQQIQAAARCVFSNKGYQASTMDEIADRAEVSKGTVYFYFKSKDELYVSLMIPMVEELSRLLTKFEKTVLDNVYQDCQGFLNGLIESYIKLQGHDPEGMRIFQNFQLNSLYSVMSKKTQSRLMKLGKKNFAILRRTISKANELGLLYEADPIRLTDVMWGLFLGLNQLEGSKFQLSGKDHLAGTLNYTVKTLCKGLSVD